MTQESLEKFGKFKLLKRLDFGGMAEIFLASLEGEKGFSKKIVIKRILPHYSHDKKFIDMFIDEAIISAKIIHPNVAQVYEFDHIDHIYYLSMEYIEGLNLREVLKLLQTHKIRMKPVDVAIIGKEVCKGLSYVHSMKNDKDELLNIVHRDISPPNIMISRFGIPKIMDFGIAHAEFRFTQTATNVLKGKLAYMSPEQASGVPINKYSDQFSLGRILWECITNKPLYTSNSPAELLNKIIHSKIERPSLTCHDIPQVLEDIIMCSLEKNQNDRFTDLSDMETELSEFCLSQSVLGVGNLVSLISDLKPYSNITDKTSNRTKVLPVPYKIPSNDKIPKLVKDQTWDNSFIKAHQKPIENYKYPERTFFYQMSLKLKKLFLRRYDIKKIVLRSSILIILSFAVFLFSQYIFSPHPTILKIKNLPRKNIHKDNSKVPLKTLNTEKVYEEVFLDIPSIKENKKLKTSKKTSILYGELSLRVLGGWKEVYWKDKLLGITPLKNIRLPIGNHALILVDTNKNIQKTIFVSIKPDKLTEKTFSL